jgi:hypothetical protein
MIQNEQPTSEYLLKRKSKSAGNEHMKKFKEVSMETDKMNRRWFIDENLTNARSPQSKGCTWWKRLIKWFRGIEALPHFQPEVQKHAFSSTTLSETAFEVVGKGQELLQTCHECMAC